MNLAVWVERNGRRWPDRPALAVGDAVHDDWAGFASRVAVLAGGLRQAFGLQTGDRVAIVMRNRPEYLEALFAIWHAGLVAVPVNARLHRDEIAFIVEQSGSSVVIADDEHGDDASSAVDSVETLDACVIAPGEEWVRLAAAPPIPLVDRGPAAAAWLFYTSGTTGRPKGATLSCRNLLMMSLSYFADIDPIGPDDAVLHAAPISHGLGPLRVAARRPRCGQRDPCVGWCRRRRDRRAAPHGGRG